jgi:hypothetical protein
VVPSPDLVLWLRADILSLSDNDSVTSWSDDSGNANNASEATHPPIYKTSIINSLPVVRFNGSNSILRIPDAATLDITTAITVMVVGRVNGSGTFNGWWLMKNGNSSSDGSVYGTAWQASSGYYLLSMDVGSVWADHASTSWTDDGNFHVATYIYNGTNWYIRIDGVQVDTGSLSGTIRATTGELSIGGYDQSWSFSEFLNGDIAEIKIWNGGLSGTGLSNAESALLTKYGL